MVLVGFGVFGLVIMDNVCAFLGPAPFRPAWFWWVWVGFGWFWLVSPGLELAELHDCKLMVVVSLDRGEWRNSISGW